MKKTDLSFKIKATDLIKAIQEATINENGILEIEFSGVQDMKVTGESSTIDYEDFEDLVKKYGLNLKDMRTVIRLAKTWWCYGSSISNKDLIEKYLYQKDAFMDAVYSGEMISITLDALSVARNPVEDFYQRIKRVKDPKSYSTFEEFYKAAYGVKE